MSRNFLLKVVAVATSDIASVSSNEFSDIQAITKCALALKYISDMSITYIKMYPTGKYSRTAQSFSLLC